MSSKATHKVVVSVSGLVDSDKAKPTFDDASSTYAYVQSVAIVNGTGTYFVESGLNFGVALIYASAWTNASFICGFIRSLPLLFVSFHYNMI